MKNTIKAGAAGLGITAVMTVGTGMAHADNIGTYLTMMNTDGIAIYNVPEAVQFAGEVCTALQGGADVYQVAQAAWPANPAMSWKNILDQVEDAAIVFCPSEWRTT